MTERTWMPETEEEHELMFRLHVLTRKAHSNGISRARIASLLAYMAFGALEGGDGADIAQTDVESREVIDEPEDGIECPECGETIEDYGGSLGEPVALPCGHGIENEVVNELMEE